VLSREGVAVDGGHPLDYTLRPPHDLLPLRPRPRRPVRRCKPHDPSRPLRSPSQTVCTICTSPPVRDDTLRKRLRCESSVLPCSPCCPPFPRAARRKTCTGEPSQPHPGEKCISMAQVHQRVPGRLKKVVPSPERTSEEGTRGTGQGIGGGPGRRKDNTSRPLSVRGSEDGR